MSEKLDFSVGDLVRHRVHAERLGIIIEIDTDLAYPVDTVRVLWGG